MFTLRGLEQCLCLSSRRLPDAGKGGGGINLLSFQCRHHPDQRQEHLCNDEEHYNFNLVTNLNTELRDGIREVIFNAVAAGDGYQTTMRNLMELPLTPINNNISVRTRAEMIARTEHARAVNTGTLQAYVNYGVSQVEIITAQDGLVCDDCLDIESQNPWSISEAQDLLPMHPNCRCAFAAVVDVNEDLERDPNPVSVDLTD